MRKWLIKVLYDSLDACSKHEICSSLKRPALNDILAEQCRQANIKRGKL